MIYKFESFELFRKMLDKINRETLALINKGYVPVRGNSEEEMKQRKENKSKTDMTRLQASRMEAARNAGAGDRGKPAPAQAQPKVGRNDPCPCGSGQKYQEFRGNGVELSSNVIPHAPKPMLWPTFYFLTNSPLKSPLCVMVP